jgi:enoyl-CoA hydratase/carnithine racemase
MSPEQPLEQLDITAGDLTVAITGSGVAIVEIGRPPNNFFDAPLIQGIADIAHELGAAGTVRALVLASQGKHFCAGADFAGTSGVQEVSPDEGARTLYSAAVRLFEADLPIVAAIQGAAIGGGFGLALAADFRVASAQSRFAANFSRLGLHHGFGMSVTLPRVVGNQYAADLLMTGRRIDGAEGYRIGLVDRLVATEDIRSTAVALADELATAAPLAVQSIRKTLRRGLVTEVAAATEHERSEQAWLRKTEDFTEGVRATSERRPPEFLAR